MQSLLVSLALIAASANSDSQPATCPLDQPVAVNPAHCWDAPVQLPRFAPASELPAIGLQGELMG